MRKRAFPYLGLYAFPKTARWAPLSQCPLFGELFGDSALNSPRAATGIGAARIKCTVTEKDAAVAAKAEAIAAASQWSARKTKQIIRRILDGQTDDDAQTNAWMLDAVEGEDFVEGRDAFLAKRTPRFPFR